MRNDHRFYILVSLALFGCLSASSFAQEKTSDSASGIIQINVALVQVDAVVTDSQGRAVTDLKSDDFVLLQDGKSQRIRNFSFVNVNENAVAVSGPSAPRSPGSKGSTLLPPSTPLKRDHIQRTIALVADDIALSFDGVVHVRDGMRKWVENEMQPGDLVSVVRTNAANGALQQFTNDKRILEAAIDRIAYQPGRVGVESFRPIEPVLPGMDNRVNMPGTLPANFNDEVLNAYLLESLNAVRYIMQGLHDLPGRKSLVLFTEDLSLTSLDTQRQSIEERMRRLADEANRSSVVIYTIDPRGSIYTGLTASDNVGSRSPAEIAAMINSRFTAFHASQDGMIDLAARTGGVFYSGENDLSVPLHKAISDGSGYYLLGYQPDQSTFLSKVEVGRYHKISVRVKRPGLTVRSRDGFFGIADAPGETTTRNSQQTQIAGALVSPFSSSDIRVRLTCLFSHSDKEGSLLETMMFFDTHDLNFKEEPDGSRTAVVDIALMPFDEDGDPAKRVNKTWTIHVSKDNFEDVLRKGMVYKAFVPVTKAGSYQMRAAVRDASNQKLGSAMQFVVVPNLSEGRLAMSGIAMSADPLKENNSEGIPAVRIFKQGENIAYAFEVFNAQAKGSGKPQLETQVRVFLDGRNVYEGPLSPLNKGPNNIEKPLTVDGRLQLTNFLPGQYLMQIIVSDKMQKDKPRVASQTMDFEVRQ